MRVTFPPQGAPGISQSTEVRHHYSILLLYYILMSQMVMVMIFILILVTLFVTAEACVLCRGGLELWTQVFQRFRPHHIREIHQGK